MWKRLLLLPTWVTALLLLVLVVIIALLFSSINPWNPLNYLGRPTAKVDISRPAVVRQIQNLNRLETASYTIDKIIQAGTEGNVFQNLLYGDRILLVAHGTVVAGVDLSQMDDKAVTISGKDLKVTLPATRILTTTLDEGQTKVFDRKLGLLSKGDMNLESQARTSAAAQIRQAACDDGILQRAADQARIRLAEIYTTAGFSSVTVSVAAGNCD
jgi:hypothetical protein